MHGFGGLTVFGTSSIVYIDEVRDLVAAARSAAAAAAPAVPVRSTNKGGSASSAVSLPGALTYWCRFFL